MSNKSEEQRNNALAWMAVTSVNSPKKREEAYGENLSQNHSYDYIKTIQKYRMPIEEIRKRQFVAKNIKRKLPLLSSSRSVHHIFFCQNM